MQTQDSFWIVGLISTWKEVLQSKLYVWDAPEIYRLYAVLLVHKEVTHHQNALVEVCLLLLLRHIWELNFIYIYILFHMSEVQT